MSRLVRLQWPFRRRSRGRRLRFTREGKYFVAITIGIGLAAINTGNNLLYLLLGWLLSMIIASGALSETTLRGLKAVRRPPRRVFAGSPFLMEVSITNDKKRVASFSIEIEDICEGRPLDKRCYFLKVPAGRTQKTSYRHTFTQRGLYSFDGFRISTRFPFALFSKSREQDSASEILVYPEIHDIPPPSPKARQLGDTMVRKVGRSGEVFGLREYRDGDDRRSIHWRTTARLGRLLVREFEVEAEKRVTLIVDNSLPVSASAAASEAIESAISLTASLAVSYLRRGYSVRLVARGETVPYAAGEAQQSRILRALALLPITGPETPFASSISGRAENLLVVPKVPGFHPSDRPGSVSYFYEAEVLR